MRDPIARALALQDASLFNLSSQPAVLRNSKFVPVSARNAAAGAVDLYTVPAGRRAMVANVIAMNNSGAAGTILFQAKIGGSYFTVTSQAALANGSSVAPGSALPLLEAGDSLSVNLPAVGWNVFARIIEFDASAPIKSARLTSLANGDNLLYTAPAGKKAAFINSSPSSSARVDLGGFNDSGATRQLTVHCPPAGSVITGTASQVCTSAPVASPGLVSAAAQTLPQALAAGESLIVTTDAIANKFFLWTALVELPV